MQHCSSLRKCFSSIFVQQYECPYKFEPPMPWIGYLEVPCHLLERLSLLYNDYFILWGSFNRNLTVGWRQWIFFRKNLYKEFCLSGFFVVFSFVFLIFKKVLVINIPHKKKKKNDVAKISGWSDPWRCLKRVLLFRGRLKLYNNMPILQ